MIYALRKISESEIQTMKKLSCVKCGSENTQIVRGIYESGTEAKYKVNSETTENPTIGELLASDQRVTITNQSRLAERLGSIDLPVYSFTEFSYPLEDFIDSPEEYKEYKEYEELNRKYEEENREAIDKQNELKRKKEQIKSLEGKRPTPPIKKEEKLTESTGIFVFILILFALTKILPPFWEILLYFLIVFLFLPAFFVSLIDLINPQKTRKEAYKKNQKN